MAKILRSTTRNHLKKWFTQVLKKTLNKSQPRNSKFVNRTLLARLTRSRVLFSAELLQGFGCFESTSTWWKWKNYVKYHSSPGNALPWNWRIEMWTLLSETTNRWTNSSSFWSISLGQLTGHLDPRINWSRSSKNNSSKDELRKAPLF